MTAGNFMSSPVMSVESVNAAHWPSPLSVRRQARRGLRPIEVALFARYRSQLSGNVLEIGCRGDGLTGTLDHHAASFTGIGFSTPEVELCRSRYPEATFEPRNLVDLEEFDDGQFDAIVAGRYALDRFGNEQRCQALGRLSRIIADDGVLIFSSHNLACESLVRSPLRQAALQPWKIVTLPTAQRNRALLGHLQQRSLGYAVLNDAVGAYSRLNYYVSRDQQDRQLQSNDLRLLECVDRCDRLVAPGELAYPEHELHFVAQSTGW